MTVMLSMAQQLPSWVHTLHGKNLIFFLLRVIPPSLVLISTLALIPLRPTHIAQGSDVTVVVAATRTPRRGAILSLLVLLSATYFLDGTLSVIAAVLHGASLSPADVASPIGLLAFAGLAAMGSYKDVLGLSVWESKRIKLGLSGAFLFGTAHTAYLVHVLSGYGKINTYILAHFAFVVSRGLFLIPLLVAVAKPRITYASVLTDEEPGPSTDTSLLLPAPTAIAPSTGLSALAAKDGNGAQYGTFANRTGRAALAAPSGPTTRANTPAPSTKGGAPATKDEISLDPSWSETMERMKRITPYLWPSKSKALQSLAVACFGILIIGRIVNWALPQSLANLIKSLQYGTGRPWFYLASYVVLRYLQSSGGLGGVRDLLWTPVMQYSDRAMSQLCFDHLLNLSMAFHTRRKTGEVLRILDRGAAINRIFELLLFNLVPIVADIVIALVVFVIYFEWTLALVIGLDMAAYMAASVVLTRWRTKLRRQMNDRDVITRGIHTDCLLNYETVKYFNGERHEAARYADAIGQYQALEFRVITSLNMLNLIQNLILCFGLLVGSMIVALRVTHGQGDASDFVLFITYIGQLYGPLQMLGSIYRSINQGLVDTEKLLKLLNEPTDIIDSPGAPDLQITNGTIEFDNVNFSYDGRATALSGVSFTVPKGASVALVGESGAGKSTILRLLYRFYDLGPGQGAIRIDGQDIRDVSQDSLRRAIGVVPQDSVLFNASVAYNIGYGRVGADQEAIEAAAKAAQMHERILGFPDGYETKVGERGVRLSGGEKQRVAIARTVLKDPPVLLLDEATSALDTGTERDIQRALQALAKGRSSLWIAHRLSTIASADLILVLKDGAVVEQGTHSELLAQNGIFASMWAEQVAGSDASSNGGDAGDNGDIKEPVIVTPEVDAEAVGYFVEDPQAVSEPSAPGPAEEDAATAEAESVIPPPSVQVQDSLEAPAVAPVFSDSPSMLTEAEPEAEVAPVAEPEHVEESAPAPGPVAFPKSDDEDEYEAPAPAAPAPVAFPKSDDEDEDAPAPPAAPIVFPKSDDEEDAPVQAPQSIDAAPALTFPTTTATTDDIPPSSDTPAIDSQAQSPTPGVTFSPDAAASREGTPGGPSDEPKRKRISSQNFQRLARRISLSGKRQNSAGQAIANMIPGLRRNEGSREASEASAATVPASPPPPGMTGSPAPSLNQNMRASEDGGSMTSPSKLSKKDKKQKRKTTLL